MENKILAIKGHPTRFEEVLEILEMLGGKNDLFSGGNKDFIYYIRPSYDYIVVEAINNCNLNEFTIFTLEEFLAKYPYKVGDKVQHKGSTSCGTIYVIEKMIWKDNQINYIVCNPWCNTHKCTVTAEDLQPYEEEIWTYYANDNDSQTDITIDGERLIAPKGYTIENATTNGNSLIVEYIKNKPQYPKTYEECCLITEKVAKTTHELDIAYNPYLIYDFQKLLICRDAYWKIAGEEMGLSEPWKPSANDEGKTHALYYNRYTDSIDKCEGLFESNAILDFPTKEMRDTFYENFKDLIESCKELL